MLLAAVAAAAAAAAAGDAGANLFLLNRPHLSSGRAWGFMQIFFSPDCDLIFAIPQENPISLFMSGLFPADTDSGGGAPGELRQARPEPWKLRPCWVLLEKD